MSGSCDVDSIPTSPSASGSLSSSVSASGLDIEVGTMTVLVGVPDPDRVAFADVSVKTDVSVSDVAKNASQTGQNWGTPPWMTNLFSLVEQFTFRPSQTESALSSPPPFLLPEFQYWAGVIMRNACRKDKSCSGISQCANGTFFCPMYWLIKPKR